MKYKGHTWRYNQHINELKYHKVGLIDSVPDILCSQVNDSSKNSYDQALYESLYPQGGSVSLRGLHPKHDIVRPFHRI